MFPCEMARYIAVFSQEARKSGRSGGQQANLGPRPPFWPALPGPSVAGHQAALLEFLPAADRALAARNCWPYIETGVTSIDDLAQQSHHWLCGSRFWAKFPTLRPSPRAREFAKSPGCQGLMGPLVGASARGIARVRLADGTVHLAEVHWYEAGGIGRKEYKIKQLL